MMKLVGLLAWYGLGNKYISIATLLGFLIMRIVSSKRGALLESHERVHRVYVMMLRVAILGVVYF